MPPKTRAKGRTFTSTSSAKAIAGPNGPPAPFSLPSVELAPFTSGLDKYHIYITHVDRTPRDFKKKIFLVPVVMNIVIICGLIYRASSILPFYLKIIQSLVGMENEMNIDTHLLSVNDIVYEILKRASVFIFDLLLYVFIWPWPKDFFFGQKIGNPIAWRFGAGFRDNDIIVRRSRRWDTTIGDFLLDDNQEGSQVLLENVRKAVDPAWMYDKTGYLMLNKEWDLDWRGMVVATKLIDKKEMKLEDFQTTIFAWHKEWEWMVIETAKAGGSKKEEDGRKKIVAFKDELMALGKENLFFKWIELVQFESSKPEGFGPLQQQQTMMKAKAMFEAQGIDFDQFWQKVGGMDGMPGMD